jgi:putative membrane protein
VTARLRTAARPRPETARERRSDGRWPGWVYRGGAEPDYRFTFANERTFLAWIRTALALIAAGVAVDAFDLDLRAQTQEVVSVLLVLLGVMCGVSGWSRWARAEHALRRGLPLPSSWASFTLAVATVLLGLGLLVAGR